MSRYFKYFEYAYLVIAVLFIFDGYSKWDLEPTRAYISFFLALLAVGMYFFKRHFRKKMERNKPPQ